MKRVVFSLTLFISTLRAMDIRSLKNLCIVAASKDLANKSAENANHVLRQLPEELREPTEGKYWNYLEIKEKNDLKLLNKLLNNTFKVLNHCFPEKHDKYWDALHRMAVPIGFISTGLFIYYAYNGQFG